MREPDERELKTVVRLVESGAHRVYPVDVEHPIRTGLVFLGDVPSLLLEQRKGALDRDEPVAVWFLVTENDEGSEWEAAIRGAYGVALILVDDEVGARRSLHAASGPTASLPQLLGPVPPRPSEPVMLAESLTAEDGVLLPRLSAGVVVAISPGAAVLDVRGADGTTHRTRAPLSDVIPHEMLVPGASAA